MFWKRDIMFYEKLFSTLLGIKKSSCTKFQTFEFDVKAMNGVVVSIFIYYV